MKKVAAIVLVLITSVFSMKAAVDTSENHYGNYYNGSSYIFVEGGVEFSIFPDGQFDFVYLGGNQGSEINVNINTPNVSVSYNSGYNYDAFVQYDDYGAVVQVENVPIYYDEFGRIAQAGSVEIRYTNRRIVRVGGMHVYYNNYGYFSHYSGFVSPWYTTYIYRPWHIYYARPIYSHCVVYDYPYRRYYSPIRYSYSYHREHYHGGHYSYANARRDFHRPGSRIHYKNGRTAVNKEYRGNSGNSNVGSRNDNVRNAGRKDYTATNTRPMDRNGNRNENNARTRSVNSVTKENSRDRNRPMVAQNKSNRERPALTSGSKSKGRPAIAQNNNSKGRPAISQGSNSKGRPTVIGGSTSGQKAQKQSSSERAKATKSNETRGSSQRGGQKSGRG